MTCVTPDGKYLLALSRYKFIKWSLEKGTRVCTVAEKDQMLSIPRRHAHGNGFERQ